MRIDVNELDMKKIVMMVICLCILVGGILYTVSLYNENVKLKNNFAVNSNMTEEINKFKANESVLINKGIDSGVMGLISTAINCRKIEIDTEKGKIELIGIIGYARAMCINKGITIKNWNE